MVIHKRIDGEYLREINLEEAKDPKHASASKLALLFLGNGGALPNFLVETDTHLIFMTYMTSNTSVDFKVPKFISLYLTRLANAVGVRE